jgi:hypothetical protein
MPIDISAVLSRILKCAPENLTVFDKPDSTYDQSLALRNQYKDAETMDPFEWKQKYMMGKGAIVSAFAPMGMANRHFGLDANNLIGKGLPQGAAPSTVLSLLALAR